MHRSAEESSESLGKAGARPIVPGDTIAAISTAAGEGAIALVRISGVNAVQLADKIFRGQHKPSEFTANVQHLGEIVDHSNNVIDQVMISVHRSPASYTGEDLVEISCHG